MSRKRDLRRFYKLVAKLERYTGRKRKLENCRSNMFDHPDCGEEWPDSGVYFVFEKGEERCGSGTGDRVVRVGKCVSWRSRICSGHRRSDRPHEPLRGSVFRRWVANALYYKKSYGKRRQTSPLTLKRIRKALSRKRQNELERLLKKRMWPMKLLFLPVPTEACRRYIERNAIALLSNHP